MRAFSLDTVDDHDRRLARRLAGLVADMLVTKSMHTDRFFQARRRQPMSLSAEMQWRLLPPLMMTTPQVAVAGALEPAYDVAGDSFDYALNGDVLHPCMIDVMGHGLDAAVMATLASVVKPMPDQVETCEVDHPQLVRSSRGAAALDQVWGTLGGLVDAANPAQSDARGAGEGALLRWFQLRAILDFRIHANVVQWASDDGNDDSAGLRAVRVA